MNAPQVIPNAAKDFGIDHWTAAHLAKNSPGYRCNVSKSGRPVVECLSVSYSEFFDKYHPSGWYTFSRRPWGYGALFMRDIVIPPSWSGTRFVKHIVYSGPKGTGALPHVHGAALNILVSGTKKWVMFDATTAAGERLQTRFYKDYPYGTELNTVEWLYREQGALDSHPESVVEITQHRGEGVVVPKGWSHAVMNTEETLGLVLEFE